MSRTAQALKLMQQSEGKPPPRINEEGKISAWELQMLLDHVLILENENSELREKDVHVHMKQKQLNKTKLFSWLAVFLGTIVAWFMFCAGLSRLL